MELEGFTMLLQRTPYEVTALLDPQGGADAVIVHWLALATVGWWLWWSLAALVRAMTTRVWQRWQGRTAVQWRRGGLRRSLTVARVLAVLAPLAGWVHLFLGGALVMAWFSLALTAACVALVLDALAVDAAWIEPKPGLLVIQRREGLVVTTARWKLAEAGYAVASLATTLGSLDAAMAFVKRWSPSDPAA